MLKNIYGGYYQFRDFYIPKADEVNYIICTYNITNLTTKLVNGVVDEMIYGVNPIDETYTFTNPGIKVVKIKVKSLEPNMFKDIPELMSIHIPEKFITIPESFCENCVNLEQIQFSSKLKYIEDKAFKDTKLTVVTFPETIESLGSESFYGVPIQDVYLYKLTQPIMQDNTFSENIFYNSLMFNPDTSGDVTRDNYPNVAMLHLRPEATFGKKNYSVPDYWLGQQYLYPTAEEFWNNYNNSENFEKFILVSYDINKDMKIWDFGTMTGNNWWTLCVPFNMTKEEVEQTFGKGTETCKFSKVIRNSSNKLIELTFGEHGSDIKAHHAYMIFPTGQSPFKFKNYQIIEGSPIPTTLYPDGDTEHAYHFIGQYNLKGIDGTTTKLKQYSYYLGKSSVDGSHKFLFRRNNTGRWNPYSCSVSLSKGEDDYIDFFGGTIDSPFGQ